MMNGRLRRGWVVEYCAGAVDAIPLVPPLSASRGPAHNRGELIVTDEKKERRSGRLETCVTLLPQMKRPGKTPGPPGIRRTIQDLNKARNRSGTGSSIT